MVCGRSHFTDRGAEVQYCPRTCLQQIAGYSLNAKLGAHQSHTVPHHPSFQMTRCPGAMKTGEASASQWHLQPRSSDMAGQRGRSQIVTSVTSVPRGPAAWGAPQVITADITDAHFGLGAVLSPSAVTSPLILPKTLWEHYNPPFCTDEEAAAHSPAQVSATDRPRSLCANHQAALPGRGGL